MKNTALILMLTSIGCTPQAPHQAPLSNSITASSANTATDPAVRASKGTLQGAPFDHQQKDNGFLGVADDQTKTVGDQNPNSQLAGITNVTKVENIGFGRYLRYKEDGKVETEERRENFVYFSVRKFVHVAFPNGVGAYVNVTERYRAEVPNEEPTTR